MQTAQANLFPAFEGPEGKNLHTKGKECICKPYFKVDQQTEDLQITSIRHRPLLGENIDNPATWLVEAEMENWEGGDK